MCLSCILSRPSLETNPTFQRAVRAACVRLSRRAAAQPPMHLAVRGCDPGDARHGDIVTGLSWSNAGELLTVSDDHKVRVPPQLAALCSRQPGTL